MNNKALNKHPWFKRILFGAGVVLIAGVIIFWYIFTDTFSDTTARKATFTVNAIDFIHEFQQNDSLANKKYAEQIITVNGRIAELEAADTVINLKMTDTLTGAYIIFAFQQQHLTETKQLKEGDSVSIKGSCSGGTYSQILETAFITFKRCAINK